MITFAMVSGLAGGVGLFLLGMSLMSDGLRLAAGPALERILANSTSTRWRGLLSGVAVTALVQSSSAVTVATIGFVNAGLLNLSQALWVLFGANVGTTMTGWLVALVGLKFNIEILALPLIGVGMILRLTGERGRRGSLGLAMAGFGLLFLGIDMLKETFAVVSADFTLPQGDGALDVLTQVLIGLVLTVVMQSSSASLTVALTAAQGGLLSAQGAAAVVIGANIGTTLTAIIAAIGATPNAKRTAAAHILFNINTAVVALLLLPWLLSVLDLIRDFLGLDSSPAVMLALFHSLFNVLGVVLIWPLADRLTQFLQARFKSAEEDEARPHFIDSTTLSVPALALDALEREVRRMGDIAMRAMKMALASPPPAADVLARERHVVDQLNRAIAAFIAQLSRGQMLNTSAQRLPQLLRIARYYEAAVEMAAEALDASSELQQHASESSVPTGAVFRTQAQSLLAVCDPATTHDGAMARDLALESTESAYHTLKAALLQAGAQGDLSVDAMDAQLRAASALRRALEQCAKAARMLGATDEAAAAGSI